MVTIAQLVEPGIVIPVVVGSIPISHPSNLLGIRQVGKAADFDSAIQRFESFIPSQSFLKENDMKRAKR